MNDGHILLRDTGGWAQLFDLDRAQARDIADHYWNASLVGEEPGTAFWLPYDQNIVLPLTVTGSRSEFDVHDMATCELTFTVTGTTHVVTQTSYRIDGRS